MSGRIWLLTNSAIKQVQLPTNSAANAVVDVAGNSIYSIDTVAGIGGASSTNSQLSMQNASLTRLLSVKDYATLLAATNPVSNADPLWALNFRAMIYDDELWIQTPGYQQSNPLIWYPQCMKEMKGRNYTVVAAPARDLAGVLWSRSLDSNFLGIDLLGTIAASGSADIIHIQAQNDQPTAAQSYALPATTFYNFIDNAISQIKTANPSAIYTVGLAVHAADVAPFTNMQKMMAACANYAVSGNDGNGTTGGQGGASGFWMNFNGNNAAGVAAIEALAGI